MIQQQTTTNNLINMQALTESVEQHVNTSSVEVLVEEIVNNIIDKINIPDILVVDDIDVTMTEPEKEKKEEKEQTITITSAVALIGAGQDRVRTGKDWIIVQDGHGTNHCIHYLDTLDYDTIMQQENPAEEIHRLVQTKVSGNRFIRTGSTLCIARIIPGFVEIINAGDSQATVFIDGQKVFCSYPHSFTDAFNGDPEEYTRLQSVLHPETPSKRGQTLKVITPELISYADARVSMFKCGRELVPSMALGHENMTGFAPKKTRCPILPGQKVRVCVYSDGVSDMQIDNDLKEDSEMQSMNVTELVDKYEKRWKQQWLFAEDISRLDKTVQTNMGGSFDDLCMGIIDIV